MLEYAYRLKFKERPDYQKMRFMIKKIMIESDFVPDNNKFDWSLKRGERFKKFDRRKDGSQISSCECNPEDMEEVILVSDQ